MKLTTHLYKKYARISAMEMSEKNEIIGAPYNMEEPLKSLI